MAERKVEEKTKVKREGLGESEERVERTVKDEFGDVTKEKTEKKIETD